MTLTVEPDAADRVEGDRRGTAAVVYCTAYPVLGAAVLCDAVAGDRGAAAVHIDAAEAGSRDGIAVNQDILLGSG